jgi:hypothetical protein
VLKNLRRPDLTIDLIAREHGLSPRQAQRFFAQSGTTFTEFVRKDYLWHIGFSVTPAFVIERSAISPIRLGLVTCPISTANFADASETPQPHYAGRRKLLSYRRFLVTA